MTPAFNNGYSLGLKYPWVYGNDRVAGRVAVWCRHCGFVLHVSDDHNPTLAFMKAEKIAYDANDVSIWPSAEVIAAIDATP